MGWKKMVLIGLVCLLSASSALAHGGLSIGIGLGIPLYPRPCYYPGPYYYPRPVYYAPPVYVPAPVYYQQPVVVQPAPTVQPVPYVQQTAAPPVAQPSTTVTSTFQPADWKKSPEVIQLLQLLNDPDEKVRSESVIQLGRLKSDQAVDPLAATLASDKSPLVRDSAAKALGLIGAPRALTVLLHAAKVDPDNDVRHSAQFAVEIIKINSGLK